MIFIGTGALGPLGSFQTFLLAVVNVLMQVGQVSPDILYCLAYMQGEIMPLCGSLGSLESIVFRGLLTPSCQFEKV